MLPHVTWHFPFRYWVELRNSYIASQRERAQRGPAPVFLAQPRERVVEWDAEQFEGEAN